MVDLGSNTYEKTPKKNMASHGKSIISSLLNLTGVGEGGDKKSSTVEKRLLLNSLLSIFS